ncbi:MAG: trypsin-like peptidase domain-containing protein [Natronospirillum sp.]
MPIKKTFRITIFISLMLLLLGSMAQAQQSVKGLQRFPVVQPDTLVQGEVDVSRGGQVEQRYRIQLPDDVVALHVEILQADADLDLALSRLDGERIALSEDTTALETLTLFRQDNTELAGGQYFLDVLYQYADAPTGRTALPFELMFQVTDTTSRRTLVPGQAHHDRLQQTTGMVHYYRIEVPADADTMRIDLFDTVSDVDIFLFRGSPSADIFSSHHYAATVRPQERLIIGTRSEPPLQPGTTYHLVVADQVERLRDVTYGVHVALDSQPPQFLQHGRLIPAAKDDLERVLLATVEVLTTRTSGSGTFISARGHVLTNYHVVEDYLTDEAPIVLGVSLDHSLPSQEMFHAEVLAVAPERDMALLRITEGVYGESIQDYVPLPYVRLHRDDDLRIGDALTVIGYPAVGGRWARGTISLTRGYVSGFEADEFGSVIKTDTEFSQGNSGGSALDSQLRLVGIPTETVGQGNGKLGYVYPVLAMPHEWLDLLSN